jgi:hypothetical protein
MMGKGESILHILFDGPDDLASRMIEGQRASGYSLKVLDMSEGGMDAHDLVDEIFETDKIFSWHA